MPPDEARMLAERLIREHGLDDWRIRIDNARQRCGSCNFGSREITLSRHFAALNSSAEVRHTVLHEIAHALAGPDHAHDAHWQAIARRIGARDEATNRSAIMPQPRWGLRCVSCGSTVARRHRRTLSLSRIRCRQCGVARGELRWVDLSAAR